MSLLLRSLLSALALLPLPFAHLLGWLLGIISWVLPTSTRRVCTTNIRLCFPELSWMKQQQMILRSLAETGKGIMELGILWRANPTRVSKMIRKVSGQAILDQAFASDEGLILIIPHLGAWELLSIFIGLRHEVSAMYREPRIKALDEVVVQARARVGVHLIRADRAGVKQVLQRLRNGEAMALLPDQQPKRGDGEFAPFFGVAALTGVLVPKLVARTNTKVVWAVAARLPYGMGYTLDFSCSSPAIDSGDTVQDLTALNQNIERLVRKHPYQYQWTYKRFGRRPHGEGPLY